MPDETKTQPITISLADYPALGNCQPGEQLEVTENDGTNLTIEKVDYPDEEGGADTEPASSVPSDVVDRGLKMVGKKSTY